MHPRQDVYSFCRTVLSSVYRELKRPGSGTNLLSRRDVMRAADFYSLFYVFMLSLVMTVVTPLRCSEHSQDWHTICWIQLATVRFVFDCYWLALCVCSSVVCMLLICGWCASDLWLVCHWFMLGVLLICGWCATELWLACRWFVVGVRLNCALRAADLWLVCSCMVVGVRLNCCCFAQDLSLASLWVVDIIYEWFVFGLPDDLWLVSRWFVVVGVRLICGWCATDWGFLYYSLLLPVLLILSRNIVANFAVPFMSLPVAFITA
jgi:hypothetical protein